MLNETPKANVKRIKWGPRLLVGLTLAVVAIIFLGVFLVRSPSPKRQTVEPVASAKCVFTIPKRNTTNSECLDLEIATTDLQHKKGLSDRPSLAYNSGMLFVFERQGRQCFWMKDMRFDLDMIWLDSQKKIVKIERDVSPSTYPTSFCADSAQYVVELNGGMAQNLGLVNGQQLQF